MTLYGLSVYIIVGAAIMAAGFALIAIAGRNSRL
jgi:hypothetical protein